MNARRAEKGGSETGPSPVDRGRAGSKHHLLVDATGIPLAYTLTSGNRNDVTQLIPLLDRVPAVAGLVGRPRQRADQVVGDRGYDHDKHRRLVRQRGITPVIARRQTEHGSGLVSLIRFSGQPSAWRACRPARKEKRDAPEVQRPYPPEFRREAIRLVRLTGRRYQDVAVELGISGESLRKWIKQEQLDMGAREDGLTTGERDELRRLHTRVRELEAKREILKRAVTFFVRETDPR